MSTGHVLKNNKAHHVQLPEGSSHAQSKAPMDKTQAVPTETPVQRALQISQLETASETSPVPVRRAMAMKMRKKRKGLQTSKAIRIAKTLEAHERAVKTPADAQEEAPSADSSVNPTVTMPMSVSRAEGPEHELWDPDSPVMQRISLLRAHHVQLSEQVQRLKKPA
jgi:hypothetical protein